MSSAVYVNASSQVGRRLSNVTKCASGMLLTNFSVQFWGCLGEISDAVLWHANGVQDCGLVDETDMAYWMV